MKLKELLIKYARNYPSFINDSFLLKSFILDYSNDSIYERRLAESFIKINSKENLLTISNHNSLKRYNSILNTYKNYNLSLNEMREILDEVYSYLGYVVPNNIVVKKQTPEVVANKTPINSFQPIINNAPVDFNLLRNKRISKPSYSSLQFLIYTYFTSNTKFSSVRFSRYLRTRIDMKIYLPQLSDIDLYKKVHKYRKYENEMPMMHLLLINNGSNIFDYVLNNKNIDINKYMYQIYPKYRFIQPLEFMSAILTFIDAYRDFKNKQNRNNKPPKVKKAKPVYNKSALETLLDYLLHILPCLIVNVLNIGFIYHIYYPFIKNYNYDRDKHFSFLNARTGFFQAFNSIFIYLGIGVISFFIFVTFFIFAYDRMIDYHNNIKKSNKFFDRPIYSGVATSYFIATFILLFKNESLTRYRLPLMINLFVKIMYICYNKFKYSGIV